MNRSLSAALVSAAAALTLTAGPALAAPAPALPPLDFGSLSGPQAPKPGTPGKPDARNGVASISVTIRNHYGDKLGPDLYSNTFAPHVKWSARDRGNAEVRGSGCQIEISFPGTTFSTFKTAACQDFQWFGNKVYRTPGRYSIVVTDRVSGASAAQGFTIE